jgi:hypothetical protein
MKIARLRGGVRGFAEDGKGDGREYRAGGHQGVELGHLNLSDVISSE